MKEGGLQNLATLLAAVADEDDIIVLDDQPDSGKEQQQPPLMELIPASCPVTAVVNGEKFYAIRVVISPEEERLAYRIQSKGFARNRRKVEQTAETTGLRTTQKRSAPISVEQLVANVGSQRQLREHKKFRYMDEPPKTLVNKGVSSKKKKGAAKKRLPAKKRGKNGKRRKPRIPSSKWLAKNPGKRPRWFTPEEWKKFIARLPLNVVFPFYASRRSHLPIVASGLPKYRKHRIRWNKPWSNAAWKAAGKTCRKHWTTVLIRQKRMKRRKLKEEYRPKLFDVRVHHPYPCDFLYARWQEPADMYKVEQAEPWACTVGNGRFVALKTDVAMDADHPPFIYRVYRGTLQQYGYLPDEDGYEMVHIAGRGLQVLVVKDPQALLIQVERLGDPLVPLPEVKGDGRDVLETSAGEEWVEAVFDQFKKLVLGGQKKVRPAPAVSPEVVQLD